jgi:hypothetical protein
LPTEGTSEYRVKKTICSIIGLALFALGIILLVTIVPRVQGDHLHLSDYGWAFVIIVTCSVGFGLTVTGIFWEENRESVRDGDAPGDCGMFPR